MKRIYCTSDDGSYMVVPDEVKVIWDLMATAHNWTVQMSNSHGRKGAHQSFIDVFENEGEDSEQFVIDWTHKSWPDARRCFIEWVRNGCVPAKGEE